MCVCVSVCVDQAPAAAPLCAPDLSRQSLYPLPSPPRQTLCIVVRRQKLVIEIGCASALNIYALAHALTLPFTLPFAFTFAFDFYGCELCMNVSIVGYSFDRQRMLGTVGAEAAILQLLLPPTFNAYRDGKI